MYRLASHRYRLIFSTLACALCAGVGYATPTLSIPDATYVNETNLITFADPDEALIPSITDGILTVAFSSVTSLMRASTVGDDWGSWGSPPNTESSTPRVLWSGLDDNFNPVTAVTFQLSAPVKILGFEAEPGPTDVRTLVATFFMGSTVEQTISLDVSGNAGAVLFAAQADPGTFFDSVTLTSDVDWAAGQFRYQLDTVPEPRSYALLLAGMAMLMTFKRIRGIR